ncbi:hypothetical protein FLJC2902T_26900 [Flavobacterium limnosediminis JC2902]|uniref:Uncharacterized protein n=1 Tax=Flavobacterium limnosediminis JC2902 TaxID=1341181 RepID=V6SP82_9FLAO|nr:DUF6642 family protein [Flavobacterium limnosediminis]ESU26210.1 hypothetical protein FLJC2902T_26900 [Flavobacterium limnosediminis JC2902]
MHDSNEYSKLFCLEGVKDVDEFNDSKILPSLEHLALQLGITSIYKTCDSIESFEESLNALLYEDRNYKDYEIIYLVFKGEENSIVLDDYYYSLEEIAEFFEGKLTDKILHFANTKVLDLSEEEAQYFLDVTGAKAISGYGKQVPILSSLLDNQFFAICQEYDDVVTIVERLFEKHYALCKSMDFRLYY